MSLPLFLVFLAGLAGLAGMAFWKKGKARRIHAIESADFPEAYQDLLARRFHPYAFLNPDEKRRLHQKMQRFLSEKIFHGVDGLEVTENMRVLVAAEACLLVVNLEQRKLYPGLQNIYLIEGAYVPKENPLNPSTGRPMVEPRVGEAWHRGPLMLSWNAVREDLRSPGAGANVVFHEFAHHLDQQDGSFDGTPELGKHGDMARWREVMSNEFLLLRKNLAEGTPTEINGYAATNEAEFFAVVTECYFTNAVEMERNRPELFEILRSAYRIDTRRWTILA